MSLGTLIKGLFLEDKVVEAVKLIENVVDLKLGEPNDFMIMQMIDGLNPQSWTGRCSNVWLIRLEGSGWRPNVKAYNALIDGLCKEAMVDDALQLLSETIGKASEAWEEIQTKVELLLTILSLQTHDNGVRIKTWAKPSKNYARNIVFENLEMENVANPIIIDQQYCPQANCTKGVIKSNS